MLSSEFRASLGCRWPRLRANGKKQTTEHRKQSVVFGGSHKLNVLVDSSKDFKL